MEPREQNDWLDEALTEVIHDGNVRADFQKWQDDHPEAIKTLTSRAYGGQPSDPLWIRRIIMKGPFVKIAAAAIIVLVAAVGVSQFLGGNGTTVEQQTVARMVDGPQNITLADSSEVKLTAGAQMIGWQFPAMIKSGMVFKGYLCIAMTLAVIVTVGTVLLQAAARWVVVLRGFPPEPRRGDR